MTRPAVLFAVAAMLLVDLLVFWGIAVAEYPLGASLFPAISAAALTLLGVVVALRETGADGHGERPTLSAALWLAALLPVLVLLGFRIGLPLYGLAYALAHGARPLQSLLLALGIAATIEILFVRVLAMPLDWGWLAETLLG